VLTWAEAEAAKIATVATKRVVNLTMIVVW
jgi:hypothetical protein